MRDRGTLIAGAGIAAAFVLAGIVLDFVRAEQSRHRAMEEARSEAEFAVQYEEAAQKSAADLPRRFRAQLICGRGIARGVDYLRKQQSPDGTWRSELYASFKDGTALTPLVLEAIRVAEETSPNVTDRTVHTYDLAGCVYLARLIKPDGTLEAGEASLEYPVYTASLAVRVLTQFEHRSTLQVAIGPDGKSESQIGSKDLLKARDAWVKFLLDRQLTEKLGWKPEDKQYGGWGYCRFIPKKPEPNAVAPPLIESNLSATVFALEALKAAGVQDSDPYWRADFFIQRCQNDDGGFHFIYDDPVRNKAGAEAGRFHSYGSTTADAVRGLLITEPIRMKREGEFAKPGIVARGNKYPSMKGQDWLIANFRPDSHPGKYIPAHESNREAVYYYYAASVSKALRAANVNESGGMPWAASLSAELAKRQKPEGSWANPVALVREDEPLVATANAIIALANCKAAMEGK